MDWDKQVDVVVVGTGAGGCAAALAAFEHGLEPLVLEKGACAGGGTTYSSGGIWIPGSHLARAAGIEDSNEEAAAYLRFLGAGYQVEENVRAYVDNAADALQYFSELGLQFQIVRNLPDIYYGMAPGAKAEGRMIEIALFPGYELGSWREKVLVSPFTLTRATFDEAVRWGGRGSYAGWDPAVQEERQKNDMRALGAGLAAAFVKALLDRHIAILLEAPARKLIVEGDRVTGVSATIDGREQRIRARAGVVLAAGGYEGNPALIKNYDDLQFRNMFPDTITGDALIMGAEIGSMVRVIPRQLTIFMGYDVPARNGRPAMYRNAATSEIPQPHSMVVNGAGRRFGDESFFQKLQNGLRHFDVRTHSYPNLPCYWIFDSQYAGKYSVSGLPIGEIPEFFRRGATLDELAHDLHIDPAGLRAENERFNAFVASGVDTDFNRGGETWSRTYSGDFSSKNPNLGTIEHPPFYGIELHPFGMSSAGLLTNGAAQVIHQRGAPVPGLYAIGNCSAGVEFGVGYQAGLSLGKGLIFGLLSARHMAAALVAILLIAFCCAAGPARAAEPYTIYAVLSLTGQGAFLGKEEAQSLHAVETTVNEHGGIRGTPVHFSVQDDGSNPSLAVQLANGVIAKHVPVMMGPTLVASCGAVGPLFKDGPVQYCFAPGIYPPPGSYTFAASVSTKEFVVTALRYFRAKGWTHLGVITSTDATGQEGERIVNEGLALPENAGVTVVDREYFNTTDVNAVAQMTRLKTANPQVVIAWTTGTPFGTVLRSAADTGFTIPIVTNSGNIARAQMEQYAPFAPKELYFATTRYLAFETSQPGPVKEAQRLFYAGLQRENLPPDSGPAIAWDCGSVIVDALRHVGLNASAAQLHDYIEHSHGFAGINGIFDFRDGNQRGLTGSSAILVRWDGERKNWTAVSQPGGAPLR